MILESKFMVHHKEMIVISIKKNKYLSTVYRPNKRKSVSEYNESDKMVPHNTPIVLYTLK